MIDKIIGFSIKNKILIGIFMFFLILWGIYSLKQLPIDAVPDITNNQIQIISIAPTLAANEVEQSISAPIEVSVANIPDVIELRSISRLGLSVVTVVFKDNVDIYWARQQISERLKGAEEMIPEGLTKPEMAPISSGLGEIYQYVLHVKPGYESKYDAMQLRTIQDWIVRRELLGTPGVADVNSYGGFLQQYEVAVNPERLRAMNVTLSEIFKALENNNQNTGSAYIDKNPTAFFIRGLGLVNSLDDVKNIVVKTNSAGVPMLISDVATVQMGSAPRYGAFVVDTSGEAVGGVVMMLKGANASKVVADVKERMKTVQKSLPEGVEIDPYYDRTELVNRAVGTVSKNLIEGGLIVIFVLVILLGNLRAGLVVASVIPLSMLFAISLMNLFGVSGNLMSLGAIDFGLIVDGAVIIVESVVHRIKQSKTHHPGILKLSGAQMDHEVHDSARRMMSSATFGQIIILIVYLPILALVGIEGKMFRPMAETVSFAILGAIILSLTYVPVASALFLSKKTTHKPSISDKIISGANKLIMPVLNFALRRKIMVVVVSVLLFIGSLFLYNSLGGEFLPNLEEGDLAAGVITLQGGSLTHSVEVVEKANKILMSKFPEVEHAVCKIGAGEIPTDPTPMETGDYIISMKDKSEWTSAKTREEMIEKMQTELSVLAGVKFEFQQPIQMRFNEFMSGAKQDVAIKIFGDNLEILADKAAQIEKLITPINGVTDISVEKVTGSGQVQVVYDRKKLAHYGLNIADVNMLLKTAFAGSSAGVVYDEEKRFDLVVRYDKDYRQDVDFIKSMYIPLPDGNQITLDQIANVEVKNGTAQVSRESTKRRISVGFNVRGRDVESVIEEVRNKIDKQIKFPPGYYVDYGGQFENLVEAKQRLAIAVPVALLLIFILLFFTFHSIKQTLLIYSAIPLSAIGGIIALYLRGMNFSISAGVGFIALFGVAVLNGIVLIAEFNRLEKDEGISDIYERVRKGIHIRLRPVIITASVASFGFLPMALSTSAGAEVQKPLATVVIGGLIFSTLLTLIILPVLYVLFSSGKNRKLKAAVPVNTIMVIVAAFSLCLFYPSSTYAQNNPTTPYTLEQAVNRAIDNNGNVRSAAMNVAMNKKLVGAAWDIDKTNLEYTYGQSNSYAKDNNINVSQTIQFPTVYVYQTKLARANVKTAEYGLNLTKVQVVSEVKRNYFNLLFCITKLKLLDYQDSLYMSFQHAAGLKLKTGESAMLEKISADTRLMEIKTMKNQVASDIEIFKKRLQTLLNETNEISITETGMMKLLFEYGGDSSAVKNNPALALAQQQVKIMKYETKTEGSKMLPDLSVSYFNQSNKDLSAADRFTGISAGVSIPIFFGASVSKVQAAKINTQIAQNNAEYYRNSLNNEYQALLQDYHKYKASLDYYETSAIPQSDLIIVQAGKSYKSGNIDYVEYVQSLDKALEIKANYLETLLNYNIAIIAIDELCGKTN
ncbi:MAG TPA: CusA/CzcA family heavy metal efflux RND transporter [Bacteroidales bacterium]|nr:CusA/CzcA family heavy metal efflux RND transporter [Bacteroidales bacterium]